MFGLLKSLFKPKEVLWETRPYISMHIIDEGDGFDFEVFYGKDDNKKKLDECFIVMELYEIDNKGKNLFGYYEGEGDYSKLTDKSSRVEYEIDDKGFEGVEDIMYEISIKHLMYNVGIFEFNGELFASDEKLLTLLTAKAKPKLLIRKQEVNGEMVKEIILI